MKQETPVSDTSAASTEQAAPKRMSKGEKAFNWLTYGGIAGVGTFLLTIPIAYWCKYSKTGSKLFQRGTEALTEAGMNRKTAEQMMTTTVLMQGGNATVLPVEIFESKKEPLVKKFNDALGQPGDKNVEKEPKQSWGSLIKARLLAWVTVFSSIKIASKIAGPEKFGEFEDKFAEHVICKPLGRPIMDAAGNETKAFRYGKMAAIDLFATIAASTLLFVGSRFFAKYNKKKQPSLEEDPTQLVPLREGEEIFTGDAQKSNFVSLADTAAKKTGGYSAALANPGASHAESVSLSSPLMAQGL